MSCRSARIAANGDSQAIPDAHNIFVSMAVELGVPGMMLLVVFGFCVARRATGVYALALIAVPIIWLLQPIALTTVILYMVLLGIAVTSGAGQIGNRAQSDLEAAAESHSCDVGRGDCWSVSRSR